MTNAERNWTAGCRLEDAWWDVLSKRQQSEYRLIKYDNARHYRRESAFMTLFGYVCDGTIKVTARKTFGDGSETDEVVYINENYFRDFSIISPMQLRQFEFNGCRYEELRATFPKDWTDGETYTPNTVEVDHTDEAVQQSRKRLGKKIGRPSLKGNFISAFEAIKDEVDPYSGNRKAICNSVAAWFRSQAKPIPEERTIYKYIRELRSGNILK